MAPDRHHDSAAASHRALRVIRHELERHPLVSVAMGFPQGGFTQVVGELASDRLPGERANATVSVRWFAGETAEAPAEFSYHYSDCEEDFGWDHEPNPHVDGWGHFQERSHDETEYTYESYSFSSLNPTQVTWEVMSQLSSRLSE